MSPFRHLLFVHGGPVRAGRGIRWARSVADVLGASLSVRAEGPGPWDPRSAMEGPWDLLLKVAERRKGLAPWRVHPRDRALIAQCPIPVWLLHPAQAGEISSVLAAVGISGSPDTRGSRRTLRTAALLARRFEAELTIVRPWSFLGESILASPLRGVSRERFRTVVREAQREHRTALSRTLASEIPDFPARTVVQRGPPERIIRAAGWRFEADLLVMDPEDAQGFGGRLRGPLPERLLRTIPCSLLLATSPREHPARHGFPSRHLASPPRAGAA
jgi:universal stress protein E